MPASLSWPLRVAEHGFYVERLTELAAVAAAGDRRPGRPASTTRSRRRSRRRWGRASTAPQPGSGAFRNARLARYLAGGLVVIAILALLSVLAATGHLVGAPRMNVILSTIIWTPLLFALIALFLPERDDEQRSRVRTVALAGAGVSFFVTTFFAILGQIGLGEGGGLASAYQENHTWFWNFLFHAHYDLAADGITLPLLVVTTTIFGCAIFHSWKIHERVRLYVILVLLLETAVNGVLCSADFVLFVAFWGHAAGADVPAHPRLGRDGARRAAAWFAGFQALALA